MLNICYKQKAEGDTLKQLLSFFDAQSRESTKLITNSLSKILTQWQEQTGITPSKFKGVRDNAKCFLTAFKLYIFGNKASMAQTTKSYLWPSACAKRKQEIGYNHT